MKKKLAAFLCGVMCVTAFTGCSNTELSYLKMSSDLLETMQTCSVDGKMKAEIDFDAMQTFTAEVSEILYGEGYADAEMDFSGKKSLTIDYDMDMNMKTLEYDMAFDVIYDGKTYDLGNLLYSLDKGVFVTNDTLWGIYQLYGDMAGSKDTYIMSDAFAQDFKTILAEDEYIELASVEQLTGVDMEAAMPQSSTDELYDAVFTFYEDVLDGFETGLIQKMGNGYKIEADGHAVAQLVVDLLAFVAENPEQVIDATEAYMTAVMENTTAGIPAEEAEAAKAEMAVAFAQARASQEDFVAAAGNMSMMLQSMLSHPAVDLVLDSFSYEATVRQAGNGFDAVEVYDMTYDGENIFRLVTDAKTKASTARVTFPQDGVSVDELEEKLAKLENKYNPVTGVSVTWGMYGDNSYADLHTMRSVAEGSYFGSNYNWSELIVEDGRAYLPLRAVAEALGEEVGWDPVAKTAFVMQDGRIVKMEGKLQNDTTFVAVRDFEKLGYKVTYAYHKDDFDDLFSYKEVVIEK